MPRLLNAIQVKMIFHSGDHSEKMKGVSNLNMHTVMVFPFLTSRISLYSNRLYSACSYSFLFQFTNLFGIGRDAMFHQLRSSHDLRLHVHTLCNFNHMNCIWLYFYFFCYISCEMTFELQFGLLHIYRMQRTILYVVFHFSGICVIFIPV